MSELQLKRFDSLPYLDSFFNPKSIGVIGVSTESHKLGAIIFNAIISYGFKGDLYAINPKAGGQILYSKKCYKSLNEIFTPLDLVIIVVPSKACLKSVEDCIKNKCKNISIIAAGFGETGNKELEEKIGKMCLDNNINLLGPNSLGHISTFNNLNASFVDGIPKKGNICFISQSGAYCSSMLDWANKKNIGFSYFISIGNKVLLNEYILLKYLMKDENTKIFCFYLESISVGTKFFELIKQISYQKPCIFLIPGKSKKAQEASKSHTGSMAPNYTILENIIKYSGGIQAKNTREFFGYLEILSLSNYPHYGGRIAVITNGGGVGVLSSDLCDENGLEQIEPPKEIQTELKSFLPISASLKNPIDILGDARGDLYKKTLEVFLKYDFYSQILVLLTPQKSTEPKKTAESIIELVEKYKNKKINVFTSFIGGVFLEESINLLQKNNIMNFEYPCDCLKLLGNLKKQEIFREKSDFTFNPKKTEIPQNIRNLISQSINKGDTSLPQNVVNMILKLYNIYSLINELFTDKNLALNYIKQYFGEKSFVLKLSAPEAIHKTDINGIYMNIHDEKTFSEGWDNLIKVINENEIKDWKIMIQEMVKNSVEVIVGVHTDNNFGKIMIFGSGGIYTEIFKDTTIRILPYENLSEMIGETKIGKILYGVRGEKPKFIEGLVKCMENLQRIALDIPEIQSIDANPILVTEDRAEIVDLKILLK